MTNGYYGCPRKENFSVFFCGSYRLYSCYAHSNLTLDFSSGLTNEGLLMHIMQYATPVLCVIMLAVTVAKASEITKRALGG